MCLISFQISLSVMFMGGIFSFLYYPSFLFCLNYSFSFSFGSDSLWDVDGSGLVNVFRSSVSDSLFVSGSISGHMTFSSFLRRWQVSSGAP